MFHYLHHYPVYLLHEHFATQHVIHTCLWVLLAEAFVPSKHLKLLLGEMKEGMSPQEQPWQ